MINNPSRLAPHLILSLLLLASAPARGAGLIVTDDCGLLEIQEHHVAVTMNNGIAVTQVTQVFRNVEDRPVEGVFTFPVPANASLAGFSMWIKDREMIGEAVSKQAAQEIYNNEKARGRDPGLLEQADYRTFNFRMAPIAPHALQKVQVTYYQELECDGLWTTYVYPLASNAQSAVNSRVSRAFDMTFDAKSADSILEMNSPSHARAVTIRRYSDTYAQATLQASGGALDRDVVLAWRSKDEPASARLTAFRENDSDGYFRLTVKTAGQKPRENAGADYVFLLDISGSMRDDDKLGQSRGTLASLLELLTQKDEFDVLSFNTAPSAGLGKLLPASESNRKQAGAFLASQRAHGGTDFNSALAAAYRYARSGRVLNIVLISDGLSEQRQLPALAKLVAKRPAGSRILCVGVGNDVDRALLNRMADSTGGLAAFISAGDDYHRQAASLRRKLLQPALTEASVEIEGIGVHDVIPLQSTNLFDGVPVHIYGRYSSPGAATVTLKGKLSGQNFAQTFAVDFPQAADADPEIQRMWAWRRVDRLLNSPHGTPRDIDQIVMLCQQYSIASEYTSFIVLENDADYGRWKIAQRNARRLAQDRDAQAQLSAELEELRRRTPQGLNEPISRAGAAGPVSSIAAPAPALNTPAPQVRNTFPAPAFGRPYGGTVDPLTGALAVVLGILAFTMVQRRRARDR
jgi:Ca-activated chloride channel family protein